MLPESSVFTVGAQLICACELAFENGLQCPYMALHCHHRVHFIPCMFGILHTLSYMRPSLLSSSPKFVLMTPSQIQLTLRRLVALNVPKDEVSKAFIAAGRMLGVYRVLNLFFSSRYPGLL